MQFYHQLLNSFFFFFSDIESNIMPTIKLPGKRRKFHKLETDAIGNNKITPLTYH